MGVGGRRLQPVRCRYNRCQIMDGHPGLGLETGAGIMLAEHSRVPRVVATLAPGSDSYRLLGKMSVPDTATIRAEKNVRWSEMIGSSTHFIGGHCFSVRLGSRLETMFWRLETA
ncbi:hypothetical protein TIFTF001_012378 [Ficus carica]|uniref:Uncharacterized protein n=1 Tax=Ficus carica TaxID=3494 RepID=A0AA88D3N2_FICCA|nr:hypothetical protein TIFTF001_012378 [Ficus carica]